MAAELDSRGRRPRAMVVGPGAGGAGGIAVVLATLATSRLSERYELVLVATHRDGGRVRKALALVRGVARAGALLAARRVDVVALHASSGFSLRRKAMVAAMARVTRRPYIVHVHAGNFDHYYANASGWERALVRSVLQRAARVVVLSPSWAARIEALVDCRTVVIPNPVPIPAKPARAVPGPQSIVSLGRLGDVKGSRTLVRALAALGQDHADARLVLAGDGDQVGVLDEARRAGVADRVLAPGWIGPDGRHRLLSQASVFAHPSRREGMPVALLEAMAYGLPIVATPVGGIPDVLEDGHNGLLVPPDDVAALADRLRILLDEPETARRLGDQARRDAEERYDVDVVADRIADVLDEALEPAFLGLQHDQTVAGVSTQTGQAGEELPVDGREAAKQGAKTHHPLRH